MMKPIAIAVIGLCVATAPAFAQSASPKSAAECQQLWTTADANKDNMLDMTELEANKAQMPASLMKGGSASTTTGSSDTTASTTDTTASTTGTSGNASGSAAGSATGMMVSQQDFTTACTTGQ
jgi:hypothetical protein